MKKEVTLCVFLLMFLLINGFMVVSNKLLKDVSDETLSSSVCFPDITITINGAIFTAVNNKEGAMFPLFLYQGVIYYPITNSGENLLNLQRYYEDEKENEIILWQSDEALIKKYIPDTIAPPHPEYFQRNLSSVIVSDKILQINGVVVATPFMNYPLLEYSSITYMPLTEMVVTKQLNGVYDEDSSAVRIVTVPEDLLWNIYESPVTD